MTHTLDEIKKMLEGIKSPSWKVTYDNDDREQFWHGTICGEGDGCFLIEDNQTDRQFCVVDGDLKLEAEFIASAPQIISELVEEVEYWQKRHADLSNNKTNEYHSGYKDRYDEAKHGAEGRYSLVKELREQIQTLRDKNDA